MIRFLVKTAKDVGLSLLVISDYYVYEKVEIEVVHDNQYQITVMPIKCFNMHRLIHLLEKNNIEAELLEHVPYPEKYP